MYRTYIIIDASDVSSVDFSQVLETSSSTLRYNTERDKTFVKFPSENATPSFLEGKTAYTHSEILTILNGEDWSNPPE
mgnify:CR=1 FL=1